MGELRCVDGSMLSVTAVTCRDRAGQPYEITLNLARDSVPFAAVGQRCGHQLAQLADRVTAARLDPEQAATWPDPDDRFPSPAPESAAKPGTGAGHHPCSYLPGESEYFSLRSRDRVDLPGTGELRCVLRSSAVWMGDCVGTGRHGTGSQHGLPGQHGLPTQHGAGDQHAAGHQLLPGQHILPGQHVMAGQRGLPGQRSWPVARESAANRDRWRLSRRAVIEAWGAGGIGVRAVLTSAELVAFLDTVLTEPDSGVPVGAEVAGAKSARTQPDGVAVPFWRQRGRVPDGIARSRLSAIRAQARGGANASGDPSARRGDVRW